MAIRIFKDGRVKRTGKHYTALRLAVYEMQHGRCKNCGRLLEFEEMDLHHVNGRGMGGSKRDDRVGAVKGLCRPCHDKYTPGWRTAKIPAEQPARIPPTQPPNGADEVPGVQQESAPPTLEAR